MQKSCFLICAVALTSALLAGCERSAEVKKEDVPVIAKNAPEILAPQAASIGTPGESVVAEFNKRVEDYVALRKRQAETLPKLGDRATSKERDTHQRALLDLMARARAGAKMGDIFLPEMQTFIRGLVRRVLTGPDGPKIKASLMDENPMGIKLAVNSRYPDTIPMSTMPPDVLAALPRLPEEMEYRFVGNRLILLDVQSHLVVDYVENTFDL
jgi:hypothetical protein